MLSLITVIIAVVLVIAVAIATVYYGGRNFNDSQVAALAQALIAQADQIVGASVIYQHEQGVDWPPSPQVLTPDYLQNMPVAPLASYVKGLVPSPNDWQWLNGAHHLILPGKINQPVCLAVNKIYGLNSIPADIDPNYVIQCYGTAAPYTFFYDPPESSQSERGNLGGQLVPPGSGSDNINGDGSATKTSPGQSAGGANQTSVLPPMPGFPKPASPLPSIVMNAPFITPPGWTGTSSYAPIEPTPPTVVPFSYYPYWATAVCNGYVQLGSFNTAAAADYAIYQANVQGRCIGAPSNYVEGNASGSTYYVYHADASGNPLGYPGYPIGYVNVNSQSYCPAGYSASTYNCGLVDATKVIKPADGRCEMTYANGVLVPDSRDADCAQVSATQPGTASNQGTAVWSNKTLLMNGNYGVGMTVNADGSVKTKQCSYSAAMGYNGCF